MEGLISKRKNWRPNCLKAKHGLIVESIFPFGLKKVRAYGLEDNQIEVCFSLHVLGSPCSSNKEGRRKGLSFMKSRYGTLVWNLYVWCHAPTPAWVKRGGTTQD